MLTTAGFALLAAWFLYTALIGRDPSRAIVGTGLAVIVLLRVL